MGEGASFLPIGEISIIFLLALYLTANIQNFFGNCINVMTYIIIRKANQDQFAALVEAGGAATGPCQSP